MRNHFAPRIINFFKDSLHGNLNNFLITGLRQAVSFIFGILTSIIIAKSLGPEGNGSYVTFTSAVGLSFLLVSLGFANYQAYAVAKNKKTDKLVVTALIYSLIVFIPFSILAGFIFWKLNFFDGEYIFLFVVASVSSIIFQSGLGFFQGKGKINHYNAFTLISPIALFIFSVYILFDKRDEVVFIGFAASEFIAALSVLWFCFLSINKSLAKFTISRAIFYFKDSVSYGVKSQIILIITYLMYRGVILTLASNFSPASVGVLGFALSLVEKSWIFSQVASVVLFKDMSSNDFTLGKLKKSMILMVMLSLAGMMFLGIFFHFFGEYMGEGYSNVITYFIILSPGVAAFSAAKICVNYLLLKGVDAKDVVVFIIVLLIYFLVALFLIFNYEVTGGAMAISFGYFIYFLAAYKLIKYKDLILLKKNEF